MNTERLQAWFDGEVADDELTDKEVRWLERRVFKAVAQKMLERSDVMTFATHHTLQ